MTWITHDFECLDCDHVFEELYRRDEESDLRCPTCGSDRIEKQLAAPGLATFSIMDADQKRQSLLKRSAEHTQKEVDKEPERFKGGAGIAHRTKKIKVGYGD